MLRLSIYLFLGSLVSFLNAQIVIAFDTQSLGELKKPTKHQKIELDKIAKIAKSKGLDVKFEAIPWQRSLLLVEKGKLDGVIQASYKENRAKYAQYPLKNGKLDSDKRLNNGNSYYIYRNIDSKLRWDGKKFLESGVVAAMDKYAVIDDLMKHPNITIKTYTDNSKIVRMLAAGQLDAYAGSAKITDNLLKKFPVFAKKIVRESLPIRKKDYYLIFSKIKYKKKSEEMEIIWNGLKEFNKNNNL